MAASDAQSGARRCLFIAWASVSCPWLGKRFGDRAAFDDLSFEIGRDEVFGFMEPDGTGKTTTVRTLSTLLVSTPGPATVAGIPLTPRTWQRSAVEIGSPRSAISALSAAAATVLRTVAFPRQIRQLV